MPKVLRIWIYPIKSFDGLRVPSAQILSSGALQDDRRWALFDENGEVLNAKRSTDMHTLRSMFHVDSREVDFKSEKTGEAQIFDMAANLQGPIDFLSRHFEQKITLRENRETGFPDDLESPGPTIVSLGSIRRVAEWFSLEEDEVRRRFRANIEIDAEEPFWEDRLLAPGKTKMPFRIGQAHFFGINCCQRCPVPTRDSQTGEPIGGFQKRFAELREAELAPTTPREHFNHFYRYSVNTQIDPATRGWKISVGDEAVIGE